MSKTVIRNICAAFLALALGAGATAAMPKLELREVYPALKPDRPMWLAEAPDGSGRLFILEQQGRILVLNKNGDGSDAAEFLNITNRRPFASNEEGLLGMAFHPQFKTNGLFYIYYNRQEPRRSVISEFKISATNSNQADPASERIVLEVPQPYDWNHKGGEIGFGPDGFLYIALGDGGSAHDPHNNGQNTAMLLAKMLRIDVNSRSTTGWGKDQKQLAYGIPQDNPFVTQPDFRGVRREIWAYGLRNAWRYSWDRETGELWAGDVGQDDWEEVDLIVKGGNYGWCAREGMHPFKPGPDGARYVEPVIEYPHNPKLLPQTAYPDNGIGSCIIGGYVYRGREFPALSGIYIYADHVLGTIWGLRYAQGGVVDHGVMLSQPKNITSFAEDAAGELYALTLDGKVYRLAATER